eukprot:TRINITY_DN7183_c0_g1_i1.p1 TRINITY_DN7183_c0_g1~~TRINITY_DN7183_c0_g1_i1.p1  ORF type:complete len:7010 (+),score=1122.12 TRINITY_DN7183_c0_g1_i1:2657-21031(+)
MGNFNQSSCLLAVGGCQFGTTTQGKITENTLNSGELYETFEECQQRCCQDPACVAAAWDYVTNLCYKHSEIPETFDSSDTGLVVTVTSRSPSAMTDGYGFLHAQLENPGLQIAAYPGHRSVTWCKAMCSMEPLCNSFIYEDAQGCFLRTACVDENALLPATGLSSWHTWYKRKSQQQCREVWELDNATLNRLLMPEDLFNGTHSSIVYGLPAGRRRRNSVNYEMRGLMRQGYAVVEVNRTDELTRRLSSTCDTSEMDRCSSEYDNSTGGCEASTVYAVCILAAACCDESNFSSNWPYIACPENVETNPCERADNESDDTTSNTNNFGSTLKINSSNFTNETTTTTTAPAVRIAQKAGGYFNIGDTLPAEGYVVGRVEVFYDGAWGTVCSDGFGNVEAQIVCDELGLAAWGRYDSSAEAGFGGSASQEIWIDDLQCTGSEQHLSHCPKSDWGVHNCLHTEDAKIWCETVTMTTTSATVTSTTATTTTTTRLMNILVEPRRGFIRNTVTGKCIGPQTGSAGEVMMLQECEFSFPGTAQRWDVNRLGMIKSIRYDGMCLRPEGTTPVPLDERSVTLDGCVYANGTDESARRQNNEQRFVISDLGFISSQWSGLCVTSRGFAGKYDSRRRYGENDRGLQIRFKSCDFSDAETTDQRWEFVEADLTAMPSKGFLRNAASRYCVDPEGRGTLDIQMSECELHNPETDQLWELTPEGRLMSQHDGKCATLGGSDGSLKLQDCEQNLATAESLQQIFELNFTTGWLMISGSSSCLEATSASSGASLQSGQCSDEDLTTSWEFFDAEVVTGKCYSVCGVSHSSWAVLDKMTCRCMTDDLLDSGMNLAEAQEGAQHSVLARQSARYGLYKMPTVWKINQPSTVLSSVASLFTSPEGDSVSAYKPEAGQPDILNETGELPTTDFGFTYLSEDQQPCVDRIFVNGKETLNVSEGDSVSLEVRNFDGLSSSEVMITLGLVNVTGVSVADSSLSFIAPAATHGTLSMQIMAGWKGWADFAPALGSSAQEDRVHVQFGEINEVSGLLPIAGSMLGGTTVVISGNGFKLPSTLNNVSLWHVSGTAAGMSAGECSVQSGTLTSIECIMPTPDISHWTSTQFEERVEVEVNGQRYSTSGSAIAFKFSRPKTPIIKRVQPEALSFAVTSNVTLIGYNFGLLKRQVFVSFGGRPCKVWDVSQTEITCQLKRSAMSEPALCTANRDIYSPECIVKPDNFSMKPTLLVTSKGYGWAQEQSALDTRFEIHSVSPEAGSEEGGAIVTVKGIGFGSSAVTSALTIAALGTLGDVISWSPRKVVFTTRKMRMVNGKIDLMVNNIEAEHKCGTGGISTVVTASGFLGIAAARRLSNVDEGCYHSAYKMLMTPNVTSVSPNSGNSGDVVSISVDIPSGYISSVKLKDVSVHLGDYMCPVSIGGKSGNSLTVLCTVPAFDASVVKIQVRILPFGYAFLPAEMANFEQVLAFDSIAPTQGSVGGSKVVLSGKGFSDVAARHLIRVGSRYWGFCDPISSSYTSLSCILNFQNFNEDRGSTTNEHLEVTVWDVEVARNPMLAFGESSATCMQGQNDWRSFSCLSDAECALRCLSQSGCHSFEYRARYQSCFMSRTSFTECSSCKPQLGWPDCRYWELRTVKDSSVAITSSQSQIWQFNTGKTPDISMVYTLTASDRGSLQGVASGCGADASDLGSGNDDCCATDVCGVNEGDCDGDSECTSGLACEQRACGWSSVETGNQDDCCVLKGSSDFFAYQQQLWHPGDDVHLRIQGLGDPSQIAAVKAAPNNGYVNISFGGVPCTVTNLRDWTDQDWVDVACKLGDAPGGLSLHALAEVEGKGLVSEEKDWLVLPLTLTSAEPAATSGNSSSADASLGGGWSLIVTGTGFAPPPSEGAETFVEVAVCGKPCEVVSGTYDSIECIVPNVTTPDFLSGSSEALVIPAARVVSRDASAARKITPACFHGVTSNHFEVGHPTCAVLFDDNTEVAGGVTGGNCHVGVDFGTFTNARVEKIRWHPIFEYLEADKYVGSKFQIGNLSTSQTCDELSYGWRGVGYTGCQDVTELGNPCASWTGTSYATSHPELSGHSYCRNPDPSSMPAGIWCTTTKGRKEYCNPKVPDIDWTDVQTIKSTPKMLWNEVLFDTPVIGRFVRFFSPNGNCQMTEMQVIGQLIAPSSTCQVAVRNSRLKMGQNLNMDIGRVAWRGGVHSEGGFLELHSPWATNSAAQLSFDGSLTPTVFSIEPSNGSARGGTEVTLNGANFGDAWVTNSSSEDSPVNVTFNGYSCEVTEVGTSFVKCVTSPRNSGIRVPSLKVFVKSVGQALVKPGVRWRYLDRWSELDTWANQEAPIDGGYVSIPDGQAILLDEDTPVLLLLSVEGVLVFDDKDIHLQATYIWVKGGTFEIGTEERPYLHQATVTLHGQKYESIRLPVIGAKCLAVSNTQFTIRDGGDNAIEEGNIGTLDIHGRPRLKVWTRLAQEAQAGDSVIVLQDIVDWKPGEELMVAATETSHKHFDGNGLHGAPPVDFQNERVFIKSVASDMKTITLTAPLEFRHRSTYFIRPLDDEYIDLSAEVALLSRNIKIQGDPTSEMDSWGGHTMVAFGGIYRIENAEFYRMGQQGELSRYPIHFHITQDYGRNCYAKHNSIHHSFQRAVAIHSTNYVHVKNNVGFDIVGHMFFVETGMERHNLLEFNLGVGAIPLLSGMLESDQEPAGFWTAAPNNMWRDNVAVTGSDGWYFQLSKTPISHNMDVYKDSVCPIGTGIGEWSRNRCHHLAGSCIRVYMEWFPVKDPCNPLSGEEPSILFNTTCWGIGKACYNAMFMGSIYNQHMTAVEGYDQDYFSVKLKKNKAPHEISNWETDYLGIPHIKDSVFVAVLPQNVEQEFSHMEQSVLMPQDEQFIVADSMWMNLGKVPVFRGCAKCWTLVKWRQGAHTYRFSGLSFINASTRMNVHKKDIFWDQDGTLTGIPDSYHTWADAFNLDHESCTYTRLSWNTSGESDDTEDLTQSVWSSATGMSTEGQSLFYSSPDHFQHSLRNHTFLSCTKPIRKLNIAWPEPQEVHLHELTVKNLGTGLSQDHHYEKLELYGWAFPVVANQRLEVKPAYVGLDLTQAGVQYAFSDLLREKESDALKKKKQSAEAEWLQLQVRFLQSYNHVKLLHPYHEFIGVRHGVDAMNQAVQREEYQPYLTTPDPLNDPEFLPAMTHGMMDSTRWAMSFRFPLPVGAPSWNQEPLSAQFEARKCPDEGCMGTMPTADQNWTTYILWSEYFGDASGQSLEIPVEEWIVFDMDAEVTIKNLTIKGKLSFDDSADRVLNTGNIVVYGLLEIGTPQAPFGGISGKTTTIRLTGGVLDVNDFVYIQEQSLWGKVIAVAGRFNTYGAEVADTWLRLATTVQKDDLSACVMNGTFGAIDWPAGTEVGFSPTEFNNPAGRVYQRTLTQDAEWDSANSCTRLHFSESLKERRFAGDVEVSSDGKTVSLRGVVARLDRTVVIESFDLDTTDDGNYGGHVEIFDMVGDDVAATVYVGKVDMSYTRFHKLGKGALSAAVKVTYASNFEPPPVLTFHGCSWTNAVEYALHLESASSPVIITNNVMVNSYNGGIFSQKGSTAVQVVGNAILGVSMADTAPRTYGKDETMVIVINYAGIRLDELPVRMLGNVVAGSNDMGYMVPAESCPPRAVFSNEATATMVGVFLLTSKSRGTNCQTANLYTVWKAAHIAVYLADVLPSKTILSNIVIADSHMGIVPYLSVRSAYRRLYVYNSTLIGTSPAGEDCSLSNFCRTQHLEDPYHANCESMFAGASIRRIGFVTAIMTKNSKTCWVTKDYRQCRLLSPAQPTLNDCHMPYEKDIHMQKGLGWTYFEDTTFAYWKESDCGYTSRAVAPSLWGAEVNFPVSFTKTTWYQSDAKAKLELSTDLLDDAYAARSSPCKSTGGGCMGLDQLIFQDMDGTLTGTGPNASVVPKTPRTNTVWAPFCTSVLDNTEIDALICPNVSVDLLEMNNLDRGAKDVKFGPLVLTPDTQEDNGFQGGVLSSVGPFYASCPCGWDFSFYHILIKPDSTYYAETLSLPENFKLRYWNPRPGESVLLEIYYPDSRGVNVFVGSETKPNIGLKVGRKPTLDDEHGAHNVDAQALRLYITLRSSQESFNAQRDITIRRTPTVKLKMNVEIDITEFNGPQFATNLAILLGIPPERISVAAVSVRRRLMLLDFNDPEHLTNPLESCDEHGCWSVGRRLAVVSQTGLDLAIEPSPDAAAAASGGDSSSTGTEALNAQAAELNQVSTSLSSLASGSDLAAAAGGTVAITEMEVPAEPDEAAVEEVPSAEETAAPEVVDVEAAAASQAAAEISAEAVCSTGLGVAVTVGSTQSSLYLQAELASGSSTTSSCSAVNAGYEGDVTLSCSAGVLSASVACSPMSCSAGISVTIGGTTATVNPTGSLSSGLVQLSDCSGVNAAYSGEFTLSCSLGILTSDVTSCSPGCLTTNSTTITVADSSISWSPASDMQSGTSDTTSCEPINSGYSGTIQIDCFFGVLSANPSGCSPKSCSLGDTLSVTLDGVTKTIALGKTMPSGVSGSASCTDVNDAWGNDFTLSCSLGVLSFDVSACRKACSSSDTLSLSFGGSTSAVSPSGTIASGATEYNRQCSELHTGYEGVFSLSCDTGSLSADTGGCTELGCSATATVSVQVGSTTSSVATGQALTHGVSILQLCEDVDALYTGTLTLECSLGQVSLSRNNCQVKPCEPWDFVAAELHGASGLLYPTGQIASGSSGVGSCSDVNIEYSGDFGIDCLQGSLQAGDSSACRLTCSVDRSSTRVLVDGANYTVVPAERIDHGATGVQSCGNAVYGWAGDINLACDNGSLSVISSNCQPEDCPVGLTMRATVEGVGGSKAGETFLLANTSHNGLGEADCASVNPETSGSFTVSCYAKNLTTVSTEGCMKSCTSSSLVSVELDGEIFSTAPVVMLLHNTSSEQSCSTLSSGYSGTVELQCIDGVTSVASLACTPNPCPDPRENATENATVAAYYSWQEDCTTITSLLSGQITYSCLGGQLRTNTSDCYADCNSSASDDKVDHGIVEQLACGELNSVFDGVATLVCQDGVMVADTSNCATACLPGDATTVYVAGVSHSVSITGRVTSGRVEQQQCSSIDSLYHGLLNLSCSNGLLTPITTCHKKCDTSLSRQVSIGGNTYPVSPAAGIEHGQTGKLSCDSIVSGWSGDISLACAEGVLTASSTDCLAPCQTTGSISVIADGQAFEISPSDRLVHSATSNETCPNGFGGLISLSCSNGVLNLDNHDCMPLSCGSMITSSFQLELGDSSMDFDKQELQHGETSTLLCGDVNSAYAGTSQVTCARGELIPDYSGCSGIPCTGSSFIEVAVGWLNSTLRPQGQVGHASTWSVPCSDTNPEFEGVVELTCHGGVLRASNQCSQMEVGCRPTGQGQQINLNGSSYQLRPSSEVAKDEAFQVACNDFIPIWEGEITATCGALGSYLSVDASACRIKECTEGLQSGLISFGGLTGKVELSVHLAHGATEITQCSNVHEAMKGDLRLTCNAGDIKPDTSACEIVCSPSRPAQVVMGGKAFTVAPPQDISDGQGILMECAKFLTGFNFSGSALLECSAGSLAVDVSNCLPLSCTDEPAMSVTLYDKSADVIPPSNISSGSTHAINCSTVNSLYAGTILFHCYAGVVTRDTSCTCMAQACSTAPCPASDEFFAELSGQQVSKSAGKTLQALESMQVSCGSVVAGHDGMITVLCSGGVLAANTSSCSPKGCSAQQVYAAVVGGETSQMPVRKDLQHSESTESRCSSVNSEFEGVFTSTCHLGEIIVNSTSCAPKTWAIPISVEVKGSTQLSVNDPETFVRDPVVKKGVERHIAKTSNVAEDSVTANLSIASVRRARRLAAATVNVDYVIETKVSSPGEAADVGTEILDALQAPSDEAFSAGITEEINVVASESGNGNVAAHAYGIGVLAREAASLEVFVGDSVNPIKDVTELREMVVFSDWTTTVTSMTTTSMTTVTFTSTSISITTATSTSTTASITTVSLTSTTTRTTTSLAASGISSEPISASDPAAAVGPVLLTFLYVFLVLAAVMGLGVLAAYMSYRCSRWYRLSTSIVSPEPPPFPPDADNLVPPDTPTSDPLVLRVSEQNIKRPGREEDGNSPASA